MALMCVTSSLTKPGRADYRKSTITGEGTGYIWANDSAHFPR